jgi:hypothetical protein
VLTPLQNVVSVNLRGCTEAGRRSYCGSDAVIDVSCKPPASMFSVIKIGAAGYLRKSVPACNLKRLQSKSVLTVRPNSCSLSLGHNGVTRDRTVQLHKNCRSDNRLSIGCNTTGVDTYVCLQTWRLENGASGHRLC